MKKHLCYDALVIGGGFPGLSAAHFLRQRAFSSVAVVDAENYISAHSSGNNAGMIRQALSDKWLAHMAVWGRNLFSKTLGRSVKAVSFLHNGSYLLASNTRSLAELRKIQINLRNLRVSSRFETAQAIKEDVRSLSGASFEAGLYTPSDALVDIKKLASFFKNLLQRQNVALLLGRRVVSIDQHENGFRVSFFRGDAVFTHRIINAAGAWAGSVGRLAGASSIPFLSYKRHLFILNKNSMVPSKHPFVWHLDQGWYYRPVSRGVLFSACDKKLYADHKKRLSRIVDKNIYTLARKKLKKHVEILASDQLKDSAASLRTTTTDERFVIGPDKKIANFYWLAGLGGHGVTTALSTGRLLSECVLDERTHLNLRKVFSPSRF